MVRENWVDEGDIRVRLESFDLKVFRGAYEELRRSLDYAKKHFEGTSIPTCFEQALRVYRPIYESLLI
ncbi:MAG: hypothetical protein WC494_03540 [Candidatus Pacearchaeota archaeon]